MKLVLKREVCSLAEPAKLQIAEQKVIRYLEYTGRDVGIPGVTSASDVTLLERYFTVTRRYLLLNLRRTGLFINLSIYSKCGVSNSM